MHLTLNCPSAGIITARQGTDPGTTELEDIEHAATVEGTACVERVGYGGSGKGAGRPSQQPASYGAAAGAKQSGGHSADAVAPLGAVDSATFEAGEVTQGDGGAESASHGEKGGGRSHAGRTAPSVDGSRHCPDDFA